MENYVLDTNLFFNTESSGLGVGKKTEDVVRIVTKAAQTLRFKKTANFFMPPAIVEEFLSFFENKEQSFLKEFLGVITIQAPDINKVEFSAGVFYNLVSDIRSRSNRGLNIGEEEIKKAGEIMNKKKTETKKDFEIAVGPVIKAFRDRYRQATRFGFLDSTADLDLIVLAKEKGGCIISTDEGVIKWGRVFGVKEMPAPVFGEKLLKV